MLATANKFAFELIEYLPILNVTSQYIIYRKQIMEYRKITQKELNEIVEKHQHYLRKDIENYKDLRANFSGVHLNLLDLDGVNLRYASFTDSKLSNLQLLHTNLNNVDFNNTTIEQVQFEEAIMSNTRLKKTDIKCCQFDNTIFSKSQITECNIENSTFKYINFTETAITNSKFYNCRFSYCPMSEIDFDWCDLTDTIIEKCNLEISEIRHTEIKNCKVQGTDLNNSILVDNKIVECEVHELVATEALLDDNILEKSNIKDVIMDYAQVKKNRVDLMSKTEPPLCCPDKGSFTAWMKADNKHIIELLIPSNAKRISCIDPVGACKVNKAIIVNIKELDSRECKISITPNFKRFTEYTIGKTLKSEIFDENPFSEFDTGIKCFIHKADAIKNTQ